MGEGHSHARTTTNKASNNVKQGSEQRISFRTTLNKALRSEALSSETLSSEALSSALSLQSWETLEKPRQDPNNVPNNDPKKESRTTSQTTIRRRIPEQRSEQRFYIPNKDFFSIGYSTRGYTERVEHAMLSAFWRQDTSTPLYDFVDVVQLAS